MNRFSPLRYPGGKGKLSPYISEIISLNKLQGGNYVEPFAGGAAVALDLLFREHVRHIHINDLDYCVYAFWHSAIHEAEALISLIRSAEVTIDTWIKARHVKQNPIDYSCLEVGFATFFLSRTNRSGILNGGVIGGLQQTGPWKIDCRFNKDDLISRIRRISFYESRINLYNADACCLISEFSESRQDNVFLYIDPPYYKKGAYLYENHYSHDDHAKLRTIISNLGAAKWIVSYDRSDEIIDLYADNEKQEFDISYTAREFSKGKEIMIFSTGLKRPQDIYCSAKEKRMIAASL